ncbi:hypothetical protein [Cellulomonas citrea]|uniref:hypothetical protein n=1 Tax=Cellulomonas citrea TaxID=1909423 RepID=UPI001356D17E|nr:hypothetical protein [Cellulomonas citrea]
MDDDECRLAGLRLLALRSDSNSRAWVARCVDRITFEDYAIYRRELTLDLRLSGLRFPLPEVGGLWALPIAKLPVGHHTTIRAVDESGSDLPRLTFHEERRLVLGGILGLADTVLARGTGSENILDNAVQRCLDGIVAHRILPEKLKDTGSQGTLLWEDRAFRLALCDSYDHFYLVVTVEGRLSRRVVRLNYSDELIYGKPDPAEILSKNASNPRALRDCLRQAGSPLANDLSGRIVARLESATGARGAPFSVDVGGRVVESESYHLEIVAPYDLRVIGACLLMVYKRDDSAAIMRDDDSSHATAHMHTRERRGVAYARAYARFIPVQTGTIRTSILSSSFILLVLTIGAFLASVKPGYLVNADASSATAVLLLAPGVLAAALARRSPHMMTTKLLFGPRFSVIAICILLFGAACSIAVHLGQSEPIALRNVWCGAALAAAAVVGRLVAMFLRLSILTRRERRAGSSGPTGASTTDGAISLPRWEAPGVGSSDGLPGGAREEPVVSQGMEGT